MPSLLHDNCEVAVKTFSPKAGPISAQFCCVHPVPVTTSEFFTLDVAAGAQAQDFGDEVCTLSPSPFPLFPSSSLSLS